MKGDKDNWTGKEYNGGCDCVCRQGFVCGVVCDY